MPSDARTSRRTLRRFFSIACLSAACVCGEAKENEERVVRRAGSGDPAPSALVRDPALARLLDKLAIGDPDERHFAEVWIASCRGRAVVPVGIETEIQLGPWLGETVRLRDVRLNARSLATGEEISGQFDGADDALVTPGMYLGLLVTIG